MEWRDQDQTYIGIDFLRERRHKRLVELEVRPNDVQQDPFSALLQKVWSTLGLVYPSAQIVSSLSKETLSKIHDLPH